MTRIIRINTDKKPCGSKETGSSCSEAAIFKFVGNTTSRYAPGWAYFSLRPMTRFD